MTMPNIFNTENLSSDDYYKLALAKSEWFLFHCRAGGYQFEIANGSLKVSPAHSIDDEMAGLIRVHKINLIKILEREQAHGN